MKPPPEPITPSARIAITALTLLGLIGGWMILLTGGFTHTHGRNPHNLTVVDGPMALAMAALTLAFVGSKSTIAPFWAMTTAFLGGTAAAAGIAFINSVGNLGGFAGPYLVGLIKDKTGSNVAALLLLGTALLGMAAFTLVLPKTRGLSGGNDGAR